MYIKKKPLKLHIPFCFSHTKLVVQKKSGSYCLLCHTMQPMGKRKKKYCKEHTTDGFATISVLLQFVLVNGYVYKQRAAYIIWLCRRKHLFDKQPPSERLCLLLQTTAATASIYAMMMQLCKHTTHRRNQTEGILLCHDNLSVDKKYRQKNTAKRRTLVYYSLLLRFYS